MTTIHNRTKKSEQTTHNQTGNQTVTTTSYNTIPYKGDDSIQTLAVRLQWPMLAMGAVAVMAGLILGIAGGVNLGDFFSPSGVADDLGRGEALGQLSGGFIFLGMGLILGAVASALVNIVRTLRDAGRDVQTSLDAKPLQLVKPWSGKATAPVMVMGIMIEMVTLVMGIVLATSIGGVDPAAIVDPSIASVGDLADIGMTRAVSTWLPALRILGLSMIVMSIILALTTIRKVIRFQGDRITEIASQVRLPAV